MEDLVTKILIWIILVLMACIIISGIFLINTNTEKINYKECINKGGTAVLDYSSQLKYCVIGKEKY